MRPLAALALLVLLSFPARAEDENEISFHAGKMSLNMGKAAAGGQATLTGSSYGFRFLHDVTPFIALGLDVDLLKPADKTSDKFVANAITATRVDSSALLGVARLGPTDGDLRPNFMLGFGVHFTNIRLALTPQSGFAWTDTGTAETRTLVDASGRGLAIKIQGGADYAVSENFLAGAYLAWNSIGSAEYEAAEAGRALGLRTVRGSMSAITFGLNLTGRF